MVELTVMKVKKGNHVFKFNVLNSEFLRIIFDLFQSQGNLTKILS